MRVAIHDRPGDRLHDDPPAGLEPSCLAGEVLMRTARQSFIWPFTVNRSVLREQGVAWVARRAAVVALRKFREFDGVRHWPQRS